MPLADIRESLRPLTDRAMGVIGGVPKMLRDTTRPAEWTVAAGKEIAGMNRGGMSAVAQGSRKVGEFMARLTGDTAVFLTNAPVVRLAVAGAGIVVAFNAVKRWVSESRENQQERQGRTKTQEAKLLNDMASEMHQQAALLEQGFATAPINPDARGGHVQDYLKRQAQSQQTSVNSR